MLYDYLPSREDELLIHSGDYVKILEESPSGWAQGRLKDEIGWFPLVTHATDVKDGLIPLDSHERWDWVCERWKC